MPGGDGWGFLFQRVLPGGYKNDLIEPELLEGILCRYQVPDMDGVKAPAKEGQVTVFSFRVFLQTSF